MNKSVIQYRLDLVVRLIDTTTGMTISERNIQLLRNGRKVESMTRNNENYLFVNMGREDFKLKAIVYGYEEKEVLVAYENLDEKLPIFEMYLLPKENLVSKEPVLTMSGVLPGINFVEGIRLTGEGCSFKDYDLKKKIMTILNPHNLTMQKVHYALLDLEQKTYEPFTVVKNISPTKLQIANILESEMAVNLPIARIIYGQVDDQGNYLFRVRDDVAIPYYLIRYQIQNEVKFQLMNFKEPEMLILK